jgi:hypothetical protein
MLRNLFLKKDAGAEKEFPQGKGRSLYVMGDVFAKK